MSKPNLENRVAILGAVRLPIGAIGGALSGFLARDLATMAIKAVLEKTGIDPEIIQYTTAGWVMQDSRAPNLAKTAAEFAGIPWSVPGTTMHENCASGGAAVQDLARRILVADIEIGVAVGVESMSNVPRYLYTGRLKNQIYGDMILEDGVMGSLVDRNVGPKGELMGLMTERLVEKYKVTREEQDQVAFLSHYNACRTWDEGLFKDYVIPVTIPQKKGDPVVFSRDEGPKKIEREVFAKQKPYFKPEGGTITGMNSSSINDGAAAVILASRKKAESLGKNPVAYLYGYHNLGVQREYMGEGAFKVIPPLLKKTGLVLEDIDFFEMNEAFAAVVASALHDIPEIKQEKVNQWGSGIALGHPVGCTGVRQIVDMCHQLTRRNKKIGLTSRCVGGGIGSGEIIAVP